LSPGRIDETTSRTILRLRPYKRLASSNILPDADGLLDASEAGSSAGKRVLRKDLVPLHVGAGVAKDRGSEAGIVRIPKPTFRRAILILRELELANPEGGLANTCRAVLRATHLNHKAEAASRDRPRPDVGHSMRILGESEYRSKCWETAELVRLDLDEAPAYLNDRRTVAISNSVDP